MRSVRTTEPFSVYFNYQVWSLAAGQQVDGELAEYLLATGSPVEEISTGPAVDTDGDGVPDGPAAAVLAWVEEEPATRAAAALDAERRQDKPRTTLIAALEKLVPPAPDPAPPAPGS
jgi:hypothetical protein